MLIIKLEAAYFLQYLVSQRRRLANVWIYVCVSLLLSYSLDV